MSQSRRLLWGDDEGPERFLYAAMRLQRDGWSITWASSVAAAAELLRSEPFDALVLDQMMPLTSRGGPQELWSGCTMFRWLQGAPLAIGTPAHITPPEFAPLPANRDLPVAIVSAYRHDDVADAIEEARSPAQPLAWIGKPLNLDLLSRAIRPADRPRDDDDAG
ncbi:MAG TPA: hypothetical protein PKA64_15850 [Myxococcota bacterium]|nr:hypothetical protein [Myxococcota bacterium]